MKYNNKSIKRYKLHNQSVNYKYIHVFSYGNICIINLLYKLLYGVFKIKLSVLKVRRYTL